MGIERPVEKNLRANMAEWSKINPWAGSIRYTATFQGERDVTWKKGE